MDVIRLPQDIVQWEGSVLKLQVSYRKQGTVNQTNYEETMLHGVENCKFNLVICRKYE